MVGLVALGWLLLSVLLVGGVTAETAMSTLGESRGDARLDQPATEFAVDERGAPVELRGDTLTGSLLDVADLRGRVVVVNVWGSWCSPCRTEAPVLARVSAEYAEREVAFVGINVKDNRAATLAFEESYGITYPSIEDPQGQAVLALSRHVPVSAVPVTLVLDEQGRVAARILGAAREATLRALLDTVLAEAA